MKGCFDGIGQWAATFPRESGAAGQTAGVSADGKVQACGAGEDFAGVVLSVGRDGEACALILGGLVTVPCSGSAPAPGWTGLVSDGKGGVQTADSGHSYLVVSAGDGAVTFVL